MKMNGLSAFGVPVVLGLLLVTASARANPVVRLGLAPSQAQVTVGGTVVVDLVVEGLDPSPGTPSLGGYFVEIRFDPSILTTTAVAFGGDLNGPAGAALNQFIDLSVPGVVHLDELSEFLPDDLNANQPSQFRLATMTFAGLALGLSPLTLDTGVSSLSNEDGLVSLDFVTADSAIEVVPDSSDARVLGLGGVIVIAGLRSRRG